MMRGNTANANDVVLNQQANKNNTTGPKWHPLGQAPSLGLNTQWNCTLDLPPLPRNTVYLVGIFLVGSPMRLPRRPSPSPQGRICTLRLFLLLFPAQGERPCLEQSFCSQIFLPHPPRRTFHFVRLLGGSLYRPDGPNHLTKPVRSSGSLG